MRLSFEDTQKNDPWPDPSAPDPFGRDATAGIAGPLSHTVCLERMIERWLDRAVGVVR